MMTEKFWEKALVNVVCNALGISTSRTKKDSNSNLVDEVKDIFCFKIPSIAELKKPKDWKKSLQSLPQLSGYCKRIFAWSWFQQNRRQKVQDPSSMAAHTRNSLSKVSSEGKKDKLTVYVHHIFGQITRETAV